MPVLRSPSGRPWLRELQLLALTAALCVLIAASLTLLKPGLGSFARNLWFSECIGLWVVGAGLIVKRLPGVDRLGERGSLLLALAVSVPAGYVLGYATAYTVLGEPVHIAGLSSTRLQVIVVTTLAGAFITYLAWLRNRLAREAQARALAQQLAAESELRMLRAQLQPHMLFNTLANLRSLVDEEPAQAVHMIDMLITYLRASLAGSRSDSATLQVEFAQLRAYLEILSLRLGKRLQYRLDLPEELQQASIPPMLLQPLVENAIKHGIEPKIGGGSLEVGARSTATGLEIVVADTGLGLPPEPPGPPASSGGSYGLVHVRERLRALYGARGTLRLEPNAPTGTRAIVTLPA